ncbi:hypothetical protein BCIN_15g01700 [Botrytis cinerea B05.10]|uniref:Major facilitator superfamily (MFS) profile domain-containing protein n=1 Tax=Botryotinia fuckeliana (strain B05.10) TaxID=332648 RepID=A0A384K465_BOTFB|nr:hypothetical protein BCIN_15g01700 [Botrytis cinerea B05.10]ATZ57613.1 hypothetical protein BCIN_15g01700 [Botrytis cinerea B05.10]
MLDLKPEVDTVEYSERETIERNHTSHHDAIVVQGNEDEPGNVYQLSWKTIVAFISLSMANSCTAITNTANTVIKFQVASVAKSPADAALASWIANGSFLVVVALGPIFGSLSDRVGKKWFMVCGAILGLIGGVIAGKAEHILQIIGGNILIGTANAGCVS